jgi:hypothetical protein
MPESIAVTVSIAPKTKLASGCGEGDNSICLELETPRHLDPPSRSGYFQLYGMCHELGHIAWQTNMHGLYIFNWDGMEGWAHYIGSILVDRLYELKGPSLWFEEYDYRADGTARLRKSLSGNPTNLDRAAGAFLRLEEIVGRQRIPKLFPPLWDAAHTLSYGMRMWWRSNSDLMTERRPGGG